MHILRARYCLARRSQEIYRQTWLQPWRDCPTSQLEGQISQQLHRGQAIWPTFPEEDANSLSTDIHQIVGPKWRWQAVEGQLLAGCQPEHVYPYRATSYYTDCLPFEDFPVRSYKGRKAIVISTVSWIGGKNPFLGWAYVATAGLFVLLAILGTIRHRIKPRSAVH